VLLALLGLAACSAGADETLEQVASWGATARMAAESRASRATSARYTSDLLHAAHAELVELVPSLDEALASPGGAPGLTASQRRRALLAARTAEQVVGAMARSADRAPGDVGALLGLAARADSAGRTARALADSVGGS
jgi:hypothetical protein